jgi:hypothetical protein
MAEIWGAAIAVGTAAYGAYSADKAGDAQKKAMKKAGKSDIGGDINSYIDAYKKSLPGLVDTEKKYRSQFQGLNLDEIGSFNEGLFGLSKRAGDQSANLLNQSRTKDLKSQTGLADETRGLMQSLSPEAAAQVKAANAEAAAARQRAQGLTGQEERSAQQYAREGSADRGRELDNSSIFSEALNRDSLLAGKRQEANQATNNAFQLGQSFYSQPGLNYLSQTPQSYSAGQGLLGIGLSSIGSATPQLINPDVGVNVGAANRQNQLGAASAAAQSSAAQNSAYLNAGTSIFDSYLKYAK